MTGEKERGRRVFRRVLTRCAYFGTRGRKGIGNDVDDMGFWAGLGWGKWVYRKSVGMWRVGVWIGGSGDAVGGGWRGRGEGGFNDES